MTSPVSPSETIAKALEGVTPEEIAAAWATWKSRHGEKLGPGPAFREAIEAVWTVRRPFIETLALKLEAMQREMAELREAAGFAKPAMVSLKGYERDLGDSLLDEYELGRIEESRQSPSFRIRVGHIRRLARTLIQGEKK